MYLKFLKQNELAYWGQFLAGNNSIYKAIALVMSIKT
jgi:hypothetical protein